MPYLIITHDGQNEDRIELGDGTLRIGRDPSNDLVLTDPTKFVSRFHAELRPTPRGYVIVDLKTPNGIRVGSRQVTEAALSPGVRVVIGPYVIDYLDDRLGEAPTDPNEGTVLAPSHLTGSRAPIRAPESSVPAQLVFPRQSWSKRQRQAAVFAAVVASVAVVGLIASQLKPAGDPGPRTPPPSPPTPTVVAQTSAPSASDLVQQCDRAIAAGDAMRAQDLLGQIRQADPLNGELDRLERSINDLRKPKENSATIVTKTPRGQPENCGDPQIPQMAGETLQDCVHRADRIRTSYAEGEEAMRLGDPKTAVAKFDEVLQAFPAPSYRETMREREKASQSVEKKAKDLVDEARRSQAPWAEVQRLFDAAWQLKPSTTNLDEERRSLIDIREKAAAGEIKHASQLCSFASSLATAQQELRHAKESVPSDSPQVQKAMDALRSCGGE